MASIYLFHSRVKNEIQIIKAEDENSAWKILRKLLAKRIPSESEKNYSLSGSTLINEKDRHIATIFKTEGPKKDRKKKVDRWIWFMTYTE